MKKIRAPAGRFESKNYPFRLPVSAHATVTRIELGERRVGFIEFYHTLQVLGAKPKTEIATLMARIG